MRARSVYFLSILGLVALVSAPPSAQARSLAPGEAAPPLQTLDLTRPGPRPSAVTQQAAPPAPGPAAKATPKPPTAVAKAKPGPTVATGPARKTTKAPPKTARGKPAPKPTT
jgi:hypothetical protein